MPQWIIRPSGMIEPVPVPEYWIDNMDGLELLNGGHAVRGYLCARQLPIECPDGEPQNILTVKLGAPLMLLPRIMGQMAQCFFRGDAPEIGARGPPTPYKPHVVR